MLEPLGDQIRIDAIRELRHDLHMRPFEADRRVYLVFGAHTLNDEAADALLKDLEEPPPYAVAVLVADELGPLPETIRSRCQPVPFRRLAERRCGRRSRARAGALGGRDDVARAGRRRAARPGRPAARSAGCEAARGRARGRALRLPRPGFEPRDAADVVMGIARRARAEAKERAQGENEELDLTPREKEQRTRRAMRGAEREEICSASRSSRRGTATSWWSRRAPRRRRRTSTGWPSCGRTRRWSSSRARRRAAETVRETWRLFEELQLQAGLALEALFVKLHRELAGVPV